MVNINSFVLWTPFVYSHRTYAINKLKKLCLNGNRCGQWPLNKLQTGQPLTLVELAATWTETAYLVDSDSRLFFFRRSRICGRI
jgi:hypothetical protein